MLNQMIEISKGFQSSVNIEYDLHSSNRISEFIPTRACLDIIDSIISSTDPQSTLRAKILTGAYGRGKSCCVLIALSILFEYNADKMFFIELLERIKSADELLYKRISNYRSAGKRLFPVVINGNSGNMTQAFLSGLQNALNVYGMSDIMPETFFDSAVKTIDRWQNDYPETYQKLSERLKCGGEEFKDSLL